MKYAIIVNKNHIYTGIFRVSQKCNIRHDQIIYADFDVDDPCLADWYLRQDSLCKFFVEHKLLLVAPDDFYHDLLHAENRSRHTDAQNLALFQYYM